MIYSKTYKSGLRLVAYPMQSVFTVSFGVMVDVGSVRESGAENGYSHFVEHLLFKGTQRRSATQISEEMDDIGAMLNAYTAKDVTCYYTKSAFGDLEKCVDLLSDMYFNATFPEEELEREKNVVIEEILMGNDNPEDVCADLIAEAVFHNQPLGQSVAGTVENIRNSDRHSILNYKRKHYIPQNTVISVAGNYDVDELDRLVEKYFECCFEGEYPASQAEPDVVYTTGFLHKIKDSEQSHIEIAKGAYSLSDPKRFAMATAVNILGGGTSSRLYQTVREKNGLAYTVSAYSSTYSNCGYVEIYCGANPENISKVCALIADELQKFVDGGATEAELVRAKAQAANGLYMGMENSLVVMRVVGRALLKGNVLFDVEQNIASSNAVTLADVANCARELFVGKFASAYVGKQSPNMQCVSQIEIK